MSEKSVTGWENLALELWKARAVKIDLERKFNLTDGSTSPIKIDIRALGEKQISLIGSYFWSFVCDPNNDIVYDAIAGIPNAATPLAESFVKIDNQTKSVKLVKKDDGDFSVVDTGGCSKGNIILLIDDVATTAKTKFGAIKALLAEGFLVANILVVCDRQQGAEKELAEVNCELLSLLTIRQLLGVGLENRRINKKEFDPVLESLGQVR